MRVSQAGPLRTGPSTQRTGVAERVLRCGHGQATRQDKEGDRGDAHGLLGPLCVWLCVYLVLRGDEPMDDERACVVGSAAGGKAFTKKKKKREKKKE